MPKPKFKLNKDCPPENYRVRVTWQRSRPKDVQSFVFESDPATAADVAATLRTSSRFGCSPRVKLVAVGNTAELAGITTLTLAECRLLARMYEYQIRRRDIGDDRTPESKALIAKQNTLIIKNF